jgi:SSS family solute:Na+ symporter
MGNIQLGGIDYVILAVYFVFVLGIGWALKRYMKSSADFFMSGHSIPAWVAGLAFLGANLGAQEMIGMAASGAKYGIMTSHFYWVGAIPAMFFVGVFMMPFYYGSKARSVPEYLKLRFDEKTRTFNAGSFAIMTLFSSGISMHALAKLLNLLLGWDYHVSLWISAAIVLFYIYLGGLTSAIYNEVIQFFLIVLGFAPIVFLGLKDIGGWQGMVVQLDKVAASQHNAAGVAFAPGTWTHSWLPLATAQGNPLGIDWFGMAMGLGFVLSFGYWCTDFLVVQRAMAANSMSAARRTPLIAAVPKMLFPFLIIVPGMIAMALTMRGGGFALPAKGDSFDYDMAMPAMLSHYFPHGMLGLGLTALMASFMSGMAGNVTAFNTVWTYDLYQGHINRRASDQHLLWMGRATTVVGILLSLATAYLAQQFNNIMDFLQLVFAFVNAPLFATFLLGMFWRRTTGHGAFFGLLGGTAGAAICQGLTISREAHGVVGIKGGWLAQMLGMAPVHEYYSDMALSFWTAIFAWTFCFFITIAISLATKPNKTDAELTGLVYSLTPKPAEEAVAWYLQPMKFGLFVVAAAVLLNALFF